MYGKALDSDAPVGTLDQEKLQNEMMDDGMKLRFSAWELQDDPRIKKYDMIEAPKGKKYRLINKCLFIIYFKRL